MSELPVCEKCGHYMVSMASCHYCLNCGFNYGRVARPCVVCKTKQTTNGQAFCSFACERDHLLCLEPGS